LKLRHQSELVSLLHQREEARLRFYDLNNSIGELLSKVPTNVQEAFLATEKLYRLPLPDPENVGTVPEGRGVDLIDRVLPKKPKKVKTPEQKEKAKQKLQKFKEKMALKKKDKALPPPPKEQPAAPAPPAKRRRNEVEESAEETRIPAQRTSKTPKS
jgi:hypothetical protein